MPRDPDDEDAQVRRAVSSTSAAWRRAYLDEPRRPGEHAVVLLLDVLTPEPEPTAEELGVQAEAHLVASRATGDP